MQGRKRHALVDTQGWPEVLLVTGAEVQDREGGKAVLTQAHAQCPRLEAGWLDGGYHGVPTWAATQFGWRWEIVKRRDSAGFTVLPRRWVVERTFGWFTHYRRLTKDYEVWPATQVSMLHLALIHLLVRRQAA